MNSNVLKKINKAKTLFDYVSIRKEIDSISNEEEGLKAAIISNFTLRGLGDCLVGESYKNGILLKTYEGAYGQWQQEIAGNALKEFEPRIVFLILDLFGIDRDYFYSYFYEKDKTRIFFE